MLKNRQRRTQRDAFIENVYQRLQELKARLEDNPASMVILTSVQVECITLKCADTVTIY